VTSLVVQTSFLGDIVLTTPLIAELARRGPVDVLTTREGRAALENHPGVRNVIVYDRRDRDRGLPGFLRTAARLRRASQGSYHGAYFATGSLRSVMLVAAAGISNRIGFNTSEGRRFYSHIVEYRSDRHHSERLWWLAESEVAPTPERTRPKLYPSVRDNQSADELLRDQLSDLSRPFIALAPGSVWGTKRWPYYPELAVKLASRFNIVVIGGPDDTPLGEAVKAQLPDGCAANGAGKMTVLGSAAIVARAVAMVSNDSAGQHIASAMNVPTITIYGPTVPELGFGPVAEVALVAGNHTLDCRPCQHHGPPKCPLGHWRCMRELSSDHIHEIVAETLLERASA
jgi:heptosyltransferase-2